MAKKNKEKKERKGFFKEFKEFISRGNVFDMAIGIIIGGAFTAIVTALCDNVLKPIINWILAAIIGTDSLEGVYTFLKKVFDDTGAIDLVNSIYIDWGSLINAIINFLLIALVLFLIIKIINRVRKIADAAKASAEEAVNKHKEARAANNENNAELAAPVPEEVKAVEESTPEAAPVADEPAPEESAESDNADTEESKE